MRQACLSQTLLLFSCPHSGNDLLRLPSCTKPLSALLFLRRCLTCRLGRKSATAGGSGWHVILDQGKYGHASMIYCVRVRATGITCTFSAGLVTTAAVSQRKTSACEEQQNVEWKLATSFYLNILCFFGWALFLEEETLALCLQPAVIIVIFISIYMLIMLFFRPSRCLRGMKTEQSHFEVLPLAWKSFSQV